MRKQNKIISLVLVLALLLSMLAIAQIGVFANGSETEPVVPSADYTDFAATDSARADATDSGLGLAATTQGNILNQVFQANWNDNVMTSWVVTDKNNNDNKYLSIVAEADKATTGHYIAFFAYNSSDIANQRENLIFAATNNGKSSGYYVIDFDFATESDFLKQFYVSPFIGTSNTGGGSWRDRLDPATTSTNNQFGSYSDKADGKWHHYTMVGDLAANALYVFIDGEIIGRICDAYIKNPTNLSTAIDSNDPDYFKSDYYVSGLRIETKNGWGLGTGNSLNIDNVSVRSFNAEGGASLATAIANESLIDWEHNVTASGSLPAVATVDGTEKSSIKDLVKALSYGNTSTNVVLLREVKNNITVTVGRNAVVETNGLKHKLVEKDGVTTVNDGTKIIYTAPWSASAEKVLTTNSTEAFTSVGGNLINNIQQINWAENAYLSEWLVTPANGDDKYISLIGEAEATSEKANPFLNVTVNRDDSLSFKDYDAGEESTGYYVIEMDVATESDLVKNLFISPIITYSGAQIQNRIDPDVKDFIDSHDGLTDGKWHRYTMVGDLANNALNIYIDGKFSRQAGPAFKTKTDSDYNQQYYISSIRIGLTGNLEIGQGNVINIDNITVRVFGADNSLAAAVEAKDLSGWNKNMPAPDYSLPSIATVDNKGYSSVNTAEAALADQGEHNVSIDREFNGQIIVNSSANITTHGITGKVTPAADKVVSLGENKFLLQHIIVTSDDAAGTISYVQSNENNLVSTTARITWEDQTTYEYEDIYYTYGTTIEYIGSMFCFDNYIENGKLYAPKIEWGKNFEISDVASPIGQTASADYNDYWAAYSVDEICDTKIKYNLSLYSNFVVNLYVPTNISVDKSATVVSIDNVEYYVFEKSVDSTKVASDVVFKVKISNDGETEYDVNVPLNILTYAKTVFGNESYSASLKKVIYAALEYANEAAKALVTNGVDVQNIVDILQDNAKYNTEPAPVGDSADYSQLVENNIISTANLNLDAQPDFVFTVKEGFSGEIVIFYTDFDGNVVAEQFGSDGTVPIQLSICTMKVYEIASDITITAGDVTGTYNLASYINGIAGQGENTAFANALNDYAQLAKAYKELIIKASNTKNAQ